MENIIFLRAIWFFKIEVLNNINHYMTTITIAKKHKGFILHLFNFGLKTIPKLKENPSEESVRLPSTKCNSQLVWKH